MVPSHQDKPQTWHSGGKIQQPRGLALNIYVFFFACVSTKQPQAAICVSTDLSCWIWKWGGPHQIFPTQVSKHLWVKRPFPSAGVWGNPPVIFTPLESAQKTGLEHEAQLKPESGQHLSCETFGFSLKNKKGHCQSLVQLSPEYMTLQSISSIAGRTEKIYYFQEGDQATNLLFFTEVWQRVKADVTWRWVKLELWILAYRPWIPHSYPSVGNALVQVNARLPLPPTLGRGGVPSIRVPTSLKDLGVQGLQWISSWPQSQRITQPETWPAFDETKRALSSIDVPERKETYGKSKLARMFRWPALSQRVQQISTDRRSILNIRHMISVSPSTQ